jgi:hypothetical protein
VLENALERETVIVALTVPDRGQIIRALADPQTTALAEFGKRSCSNTSWRVSERLGHSGSSFEGACQLDEGKDAASVQGASPPVRHGARTFGRRVGSSTPRRRVGVRVSRL